MIHIEKVDALQSVSALRRQYIESMGGRLEPYLEELIGPRAIVHTISWNNDVIGYFCTSSKKTLLQFYVVDEALMHIPDIFPALLSGGFVENAFVLSRDRLALSACMDYKKEVSVDCYVFEEGKEIPAITVELDTPNFRLATMSDVKAIREACGDFHDFLHFTLEASIAQGDIYVLTSGSGETVIGTGVIGAKSFQPPYVDIGMCVNEAWRGKNMGTYIITKLREQCRENGWVPGASCMYENVGSRKTLQKAGLLCKDRVLKVTF